MKFKEKFLKNEILDRKANELKKYKSRGQFENAANQFRFLPLDRQKKIEKKIKRVIDERERNREIEKCLEKYVMDGAEESAAS
jgi:hypothetical protein